MQVYATSKRDEDLAELAKHLCDGYEVYDPLEMMLDALDATLVPVLPPSVGLGGAMLKVVCNADDGLFGLTVILRCLNFAPRTPALDLYTNRAYAMVIEAWPGIVRWMVYLLLCGNGPTDYGQDPFLRCTQVLRMICYHAKGHAQKEELVSQTHTVDVLFLLLRQKDSETGRFWDRVVCADPSGVSDLLQRFCESGVGGPAIIARLRTVSSETRRAVTEAVVIRALEMVSYLETNNPEAVAISISCILGAIWQLVQSDRTTLRTFLRHNYLAVFATALRQLSETPPTVQQMTSSGPSFWWYVSASVELVIKMALSYARHPSQGIAKVMEAGILTCVLRYLPFANPSRDPVVESLFILLPYLYPPKPFFAILSTQQLAAIWNETPSMPGNALEVWSAIRTISKLHTATFITRKDVRIRMCNNLMVHGFVSLLFVYSTLMNSQCQQDSDPSKRKICTGCHTNVYCCATCQEEDWWNLHSRECRSLAEMYTSEGYVAKPITNANLVLQC